MVRFQANLNELPHAAIHQCHQKAVQLVVFHVQLEPPRDDWSLLRLALKRMKSHYSFRPFHQLVDLFQGLHQFFHWNAANLVVQLQRLLVVIPFEKGP